MKPVKAAEWDTLVWAERLVAGVSDLERAAGQDLDSSATVGNCVANQGLRACTVSAAGCREPRRR